MERLLIMYLSGGLALMVLSLPAIMHLIRPNSPFGICIGPATRNTAVWFEINRGAGWRLFRTGWVTIVFAIGMYCVPGLSAGAYYASCAVVMLGMLCSGLIKTARHLRHYDSL